MFVQKYFDKNIVTIPIQMNEGQSFSFLSYQSQNIPNNITFHQTQPISSHFELKDSLIHNFPGSKNIKISNHVQVILLLQAAEIQRLTMSLHNYRMKFKQLNNIDKDYVSFQNQTDQLLYLKDQLQLRQLKISQYVHNQQGSLTDLNKYLQKLQSKYKRALKYIEQIAFSKQKLQTAYSNINQQLINTQKTFQTFKAQSIKQYQIIRDQLQNAKNASFSFDMKKISAQNERLNQIVNRERTIFKSEKQKLQLLLSQQKDKQSIMRTEINKIINQNQEYKRKIHQISTKYRQSQFNQSKYLNELIAQIQRINGLLNQKTKHLKQSERIINELHNLQVNAQQQSKILRRQIQRGKQRNLLYEEQINKQNSQISRLSAHVSSLNTKVNEMGILIQQKTTQINIKENQFNHQIRSQTQIISKSEFILNKQLEQWKDAAGKLVKELSKSKQQLNMQKDTNKKMQNQIVHKIRQLQFQNQNLRKQLIKASERQIEINYKLKLEFNKNYTQLQNLERKISDLTSQKHQYIETNNSKQIQINFLKEQFQQKSRRLQHQLRQSQTKIDSFQNFINDIKDTNHKLEELNTHLRAKLLGFQQIQPDIKKYKTFEQMYQQIDQLYFRVLQRQNKIQVLTIKINNLYEQLIKSRSETQNIKQMHVQMINIIQIFQKNRKSDQEGLLIQIHKLVQSQKQQFRDIKNRTLNVQTTVNKQKQIIQNSQKFITRIKDKQLYNLKEKLNYYEEESSPKVNYQQIISKIITVTRQNAQFKNILTKNQFQIQSLKNQIKYLQNQLQKNKQIFSINLRQKQQRYKKLLSQIDQSKNMLFQQTQYKIVLQQKINQVQSYKKFSQHQVQAREELINLLKHEINIKNEQNTKVSLMMEAHIHQNNKLNEQINQMRRIFNYQNYKKNQQLKMKQQDVQKLPKIFSDNTLQSINLTNQIKNQLLLRINQLTQQIQTLKNHNEKLLSSQTHLNYSTQVTGSKIQEAKQYKQRDIQIKYDNCRAECTRLNSLLSSYKNLQIEHQMLQKKHLKMQIENRSLNIKIQEAEQRNNLYKQQEQMRQAVLLSYNQKMSILNSDFLRLQRIIEDLKKKNIQLANSNYQLYLNTHKNQINQRKIAVLSQQITRLQKQKLNLLQQINTCRLQISEQSSQYYQIQQNNALFVITFAEIQSLRKRLSQKERQLQELRRQRLFV